MAGSRHKSFKVQEWTEPVTFDVETTDGEVHSFTCVPMIGGEVVLDFFAAMGVPNDAVQAQAMRRLFRAAMTVDCPECKGAGNVPDMADVPEGEAATATKDCPKCGGDGGDIAEYVRWIAFASDRHTGLDLMRQTEIARHLAMEYGRDRPTRAASGSQPGPHSTTDGSEDTSGSPG